jgi:hypothetical protein
VSALYAREPPRGRAAHSHPLGGVGVEATRCNTSRTRPDGGCARSG